MATQLLPAQHDAEDRETSPPHAGSLAQFGDYELLEEISRGGMGVVYRARQLSLDRLVAVKMILFGAQASAEQVRRFRTEASAAGCLQHPNIVAVHEVGLHENQHFLVMDYVDGPSLARLVQDRPLSAARAANYVKAIAEAVQYAHERGILHRDLKPSNVLIDSEDRPRVVDFGLAKRFTSDPQLSTQDSQLTLSGQVLGSPSYMPPEQAGAGRGKVGRYSDVYSLGAILYHLLTGRPPFQAETVPQTLRLVTDAEPLSPRMLNPGVPQDLETICLKCLEKEPSRRYQAAQEIVEELGRFLNDELILARPVNPTEKAWRWCRRKPVIASLAAGLVLAIAIGFGGVLWQLRRVQQEQLIVRRNLYTADMKLALQAWEEGNLQHAQNLLRAHLPKAGREDLRGFEWRYLRNLCQDESKYSFTNFTHEVRAVAYSLDGGLLAVASGKTVTLLDVAGRRVVSVLPEPGGWITALAFSPSATNVLATAVDFAEATDRSGVTRALKTSQWPITPGGNSVIKLWNVATKEWIATFPGHTAEIASIAFSRDGKTLASASWDNTVRVWDIVSRNPIRTFRENRSPALGAALTRDGNTLVLEDGHGNAGSWDVATGRKTAEYEIGPMAWVLAVALSPGEDTLAMVSNDGHVWLSNFPARRRRSALTGHQGPIESVAFAASGRLLATAGADNTVRVWDVAAERQVALLRGHAAPVTSVAFAPDGETLVSGGLDRTVKVWDAAGRTNANLLKGPPKWTDAVAFAPDGKTLASVDYTPPLVRLWDLPSRRSLGDLRGHSDVARCAAFSPDGKTLASGSHDRTVKLWDVLTRTNTASLSNEFAVCSVAFSPDGNTLAAAGHGVAFWDVASRQTVKGLIGDTRGVYFVTFSPTGGQVAAGYSDGRVGLWDFASRRLLASFKRHNSQVKSLAFSHDGALLASGSHDATVVLYDTANREYLETLRRHTFIVHGVAFSPDNKSLASASWDGTVKLWNLASRQLALTLRGHPGPVAGVAFARDGNLMATCGEDYDVIVRLWPAASFAEIETAEKQSR
ncbi:MAG: protein kinase [Verrucomicrobiales bacterium]|nr:protein kinase [Verrucomicrobiales bacterium]